MAHLEEQNIRVIRDWPPQSPDLNIIDCLWDVLKRKVSDKNVLSRDQLWEVALEAFHSISNETIRTIYDSLPRKAASVFKKEEAILFIDFSLYGKNIIVFGFFNS